jgi:hypothetical protein
MKFFFVSFASSNLYRSSNRIYKQALNMKIYDDIFIFSEKDLPGSFSKKFKGKLTMGTRGYGYWVWKPQILLNVLSQIKDGDIIQYTDAGCHLNLNGVKRLKQYFALAQNSKNGILAFQAGNPFSIPNVDNRIFPLLPDKHWIKGDLLDYFHVRNDAELLDSPTIGAGVIFIRKCPESIAIIREWLDIIEYDFSLVDDSPSLSSNLPGFIEHRHDQAIFSILCKKYGVTKLSAYEYWYPSKRGKKADWSVLANYPIHALRDLDEGFLINSINASKKIFKKILESIKFIK